MTVGDAECEGATKLAIAFMAGSGEWVRAAFLIPSLSRILSATGNACQLRGGDPGIGAPRPGPWNSGSQKTWGPCRPLSALPEFTAQRTMDWVLPADGKTGKTDASHEHRIRS